MRGAWAEIRGWGGGKTRISRRRLRQTEPALKPFLRARSVSSKAWPQPVCRRLAPRLTPDFCPLTCPALYLMHGLSWEQGFLATVTKRFYFPLGRVKGLGRSARAGVSHGSPSTSHTDGRVPTPAAWRACRSASVAAGRQREGRDLSGPSVPCSQTLVFQMKMLPREDGGKWPEPRASHAEAGEEGEDTAGRHRHRPRLADRRTQ